MLGFVCAPFKYWTGGITYTVQVAKTSYHSGRLRISFVPSGTAGQTYDANNCYTWVLDLRTSNQIEFTIPYAANTQFKNLVLFPKGVAPDVSFTTGVLQFEVLNRLRTPDTLPQVVQVNLWIKGAEDFKLAVPDFTRYVVTRPIVPESEPEKPTEYVGFIPDVEENKHIRPGDLMAPNRRVRALPDYDAESDYESQVLGNFQDPGFNDFSSAAKMFEMNSSPPLEKSGLSIGEDISSVRQLIKRFGYHKIEQCTGSGYYVLGSTSHFGKPYSIAEVANDKVFTQAPIEYFSWIYRFYRGGRRYKFMSLPNATNFSGGPVLVPFSPEVDVYSGLRVAYENTPSAIVSADSIIETSLNRYCKSSNFTNYTFSKTNEVSEVTLPYYHNCHILPIMSQNGDALSDIKYNSFLFEARVRQTSLDPVTGGVTMHPSLLIAAADDFDFGWVVGQPTIAALPTV
jgi:hypothetical protein